MKTSSNIFELVKALSATEIKYIVACSKQCGGTSNKYLFLFHELVAQSVYDEVQLRKALQLQNNPNNYAFTKNYLYHFILSRLEELNNITQVRLRRNISLGELCMNPKFIDLVEPILRETYSESYHLQLFDNCLTIYKIYLKSGMKFPFDPKQIPELLKAKESLLHYKDLFANVRLRHHQTSFIRDILKRDEFKNVYEEELLESDPRYNLNHKIFLYLAKGIVYYANNDSANGLRICNELIKFWDKHPEMIDVRFPQYYNTFYNKALICSDGGNYKEAIEIIHHLRKKLEDLKRGNLFQKYMLYNLLINVNNACGQFEKSLEVIDEYIQFRSGLAYSEDTDHSEQQYYFYLAKVYYGTGKLKEALRCINYIISNELEYNSDITCMTHVLHTIILFESGKTDVIEYKIGNTERLLEKRGCMLGAVQLLMRFHVDYINIRPTQSECQKMLVKLKEGIDRNIRMDPMQQNLLIYFNISAWVQSRIENCTLAEMLQRENQIA